MSLAHTVRPAVVVRCKRAPFYDGVADAPHIGINTGSGALPPPGHSLTLGSPNRAARSLGLRVGSRPLGMGMLGVGLLLLH